MQGVPRVFLLPLFALLLSLSGCGSEAIPNAATPPSGATSQSPDAKATGATPTPTPTPTSGPTGRKQHRGHKIASLPSTRRAALDAHLLPVDRMPSLGDGFSWAVVAPETADADRVGACQKTALDSIGAVTAIRRTFTAASDSAGPGADAVQVVAEFADPKSAWRAHEVLKSWREDCEERLDYPRKDVTPLHSIAVRTGTGQDYRTVYGRSLAKAHLAGLGIVRRGSYLSIVEIVTRPQDYPDGRDPARVAVRRIARTFA